MIEVAVKSQIPQLDAEDLTAIIDMGAERPLVSRQTLRSHPGGREVLKFQAGKPLDRPHLCALATPTLIAPAAAAPYYPDTEKIKILSAEALDTARRRRAPNLVFLLDSPRGGEAAVNVAEGLALFSYRFDKYRKPKPDSADPKVVLVVPGAKRAAVAAAVKARLRLCESVNRARDLVNEPGSVATPAEIEARARAVAESSGLSIQVLDEKRLKKEGYEGLVTVGRGGNVPPRMIVLSYEPRAAGAKEIHLGLLGKGLTFDTGGVSIKPSAGMWQMKGDMGGSAAVLYGMEAIAALKPKVRVTGIIVTSQNYVDANSVLPGDIIRGRNGKTIHIDNTDAEGRLILTDGLWRAGEEKVTHLVDIATLTGSIMRALGHDISGSFGNDGFVDRVGAVAGGCGEPCWKMPLVEQYIELLKCDVADINNIGSSPNGGSIQAALFLREFLPEGISWTHLDIAGTFINDKRKRYMGPGATGVMVKTFAALAQQMAEPKRKRPRR